MAFLFRRMPLNCTTASLPPFSCFACIHFSPFSSHTITPSPANPQTPLPPISLFLLTECDLSPSQISKIMQTRKALLKTRSTATAREAVDFLKQWGFTQPQLHSIVLRYPSVLSSKVDTQLKPKLHFLRTLGFTDPDLRNLISMCPKVLGTNLASNIIPRISFLENLFGGAKPNLIKALKRSPLLLVNNIEKNLKPKLDCFKQWGIQGEMLSLLLLRSPSILVRSSIETLRERMEYASNTMGIVQGSKNFECVIRVLLCNGTQTVEKKMKHLQCLGLLEDEVREILKKQPNLLTCSTKKIQENMDFLTQTAGLKPNVVFLNSYLLLYSVKKRLVPRLAVFKALSSEQQSGRSLLSIFKLTELSFLEKIVKCSPQASMLKEIYIGKIAEGRSAGLHS